MDFCFQPFLPFKSRLRLGLLPTWGLPENFDCSSPMSMETGVTLIIAQVRPDFLNLKVIITIDHRMETCITVIFIQDRPDFIWERLQPCP